jgi:transcriptional regulator with XRE-family HTH domain
MARRRDDVVDVLVGRNIRILRKQRSMSQTDLANKIGVTFQQVQKYENGTNRVGSGRLFRIAAVMNVPVTTLFDGVEQANAAHPESSPTALLAGPYALRLLQAFSQLEDTTLRKSIAEMVERMPAAKSDDTARQKRR